MRNKNQSAIKTCVAKNKYSKSNGQMKIVFNAFYERPKTMLMVSIETGILRANICRYVAEWRKSNKVATTKKNLCEISKHRAGFLTTNSKLFPKKSNQSKLF